MIWPVLSVGSMVCAWLGLGKGANFANLGSRQKKFTHSCMYVQCRRSICLGKELT